MSVTFVTAFHPVRDSIEPYEEKFAKWASTGVPILLFLEEGLTLSTHYPNVTIVPSKLDMSWVPEDVQLPHSRSLTKDTKQYLVLMLHKLKYMNEATELCKTPYLAWLDFGIDYIIRYPKTTYSKLKSLSTFSHPLTTILNPGCWGPNANHDIWNSVYWRFCGGFFLGPRDVFAKAYARQMELVYANLPKLTWEVNYWTKMEEFFTFYQADHNDNILMNLPYSASVQRITSGPHYIAGHRKVSVGGPIEEFVFQSLPPNVTATFVKTDMLIEETEFNRMRKSSSWEDPAIHNEASIRNQCRPITGTVPLLCVDTTRNINSRSVFLLPSSDDVFENGLEFPYDLPDWDSRKSEIVWRGASSGCEVPSLRMEVMQNLTRYLHANAKFTKGGWPQNDSLIPESQFGDSLTTEEQLQYKYILSIEGNGAASNIDWIFASGSVPILSMRPGTNFWFREYLQDGVNCILEETNIQDRIEWLRTHDEEARKIAENALEFGRRIFSPKFQREHIRRKIEDVYPISYDWSEYIKPDREHHPFLESIGKEYRNSIFIDIGTHVGASAYALSREKSNFVHSFDIMHKSKLPPTSNVSYHTDNLMTPEGREKWKEILLKSPLILLDIDPHEGIDEYEFYEWLRDNNYQGILICDDIWHFENMRKNFWYKIPYEHKIDVTDQGHWSGTGIVRFQPTPRWPANPDISNWTVVTGYFDLTKREDASPAIKSRPFEHYLQHSTSTMMLDQNMIVFCEPHTVDYIRAKRPKELLPKTRFIVMNFNDFPMSEYADQIKKNRETLPDCDERNTVSYYLLCMARYSMLKQAIEINPFRSTHFMWLNICIERMGIRNVRELPRVFQVQRDKFSTCYIDYQPKEDYLEKVMRFGKCSMCSGFFTGRADYMKAFCDAVESKFVDCVNLGYGHADEQLFSLVYFDSPDIFEVYYGDYTEMITNYEWVHERASEPLRLLITHSYEKGDFATCKPACDKLWESHKRGYARLSSNEVEYLAFLREKLAKE